MFALAALGIIAMVLSACAPASSPDPAPSASAALDEFYGQEIEFTGCAEFAQTEAASQFFATEGLECAHLAVPMDYSSPPEERMQIGVLRVPAQGTPDERIGSLVMNPGGPGESGMLIAAALSLRLAESPVLQRFDLIGVDPRGVGASTPSIRCFTDAERDAGAAKTTLVGASGAWTQEDTAALVDKCAHASGGEDVLAAVGTRDAARDLDVLRAVLGDEKLTFFGMSYGTRLGAVYAEQFPDKVRALVLDGAVDPRADGEGQRLATFSGFQRSFEQVAAYCAQSVECPLGSDPDQATRMFQELVQPLVNEPVPAGEGRTATFDQVIGGVGGSLYAEESWDAAIAGIAQLKHEGRADQLLALNDLYTGRGSDGTWSTFLDANLAINCMDEERRTPAAEEKLRAQAVAISPWLDSGEDVIGSTRHACEGWPAAPTLGFPYAQDITGLPDTLVISITGDPSTPYEGGVSLAESLGSALLTVEGERHTIALQGISPCVDRAVADYLIDLRVPPADARCTL
ncbi:alpha/beta hydrolase [Microbacterium sp. zg.Y1090]|uniref:alpha/beta hydrolase n=1 Tax=Microbacterium wangruii TaxID=3049073 RepID=UPI00214DAB2F|nr:MULTISPECIES: alpha/beta hydrolase [unclassified Microbacterium]MCR2819499.1 alpha/beta hydrolase [Microbacterium sp. zg.Y1090]WIM28471.1 alpha/beta hydrolase [Microbacterium sp. zg-Y1090]